jgi:hypothetical protein
MVSAGLYPAVQPLSLLVSSVLVSKLATPPAQPRRMK